MSPIKPEVHNIFQCRQKGTSHSDRQHVHLPQIVIQVFRARGAIVLVLAH